MTRVSGFRARNRLELVYSRGMNTDPAGSRPRRSGRALHQFREALLREVETEIAAGFVYAQYVKGVSRRVGSPGTAPVYVVEVLRETHRLAGDEVEPFVKGLRAGVGLGRTFRS